MRIRTTLLVSSAVLAACSSSPVATTPGGAGGGGTTSGSGGASGGDCLIARWCWEDVKSPVPNGALRSVWGTSANDVWVAGEGILSHWNGATWVNTAPLAADSTPLTFSAVWAASPTDAWALDAKFGNLYRWDGMHWTTSMSVAALMTIWGIASDDVWMVGLSSHIPGSDEAPIFHFDGASWNQVSSGTKKSLLGISGSSKTAAWAVGEGGTILVWDGAKWTASQSNTTTQLNGVWASSPQSDLWAVGVGGVAHGDGSTWTFAQDASLHLTAVFGSGPLDVYALGDDSTGNVGILRHYDGSAWSSLFAGSYSGQDLSAIWGTTTGEMWAVGGGARVLHHRP